MHDSLDETLAALSDPTRRRVVSLLSQKPLRSSELAAALSTSRPAMSRHLRILRESGLVSEETLEDDARSRVYQLRQAPFSNLRSWLDGVEAFWTDQLLAFKAHAETRRGRPKNGS